MASYTLIVALFAIAGSVSAYPLNPAKTARLGNAGFDAHKIEAPDDWDPEVLKRMTYKYKSEGPELRIINGDLVTGAADYPSVVSLIRIDKSDQTFEHRCTGTMIDSNLVLTSAGCTINLDQDSYIYAACGGLVDLQALESENCASWERAWRPSAFKISEPHFHDLSVIKLEKSLTDPVKPIKISFAKPKPGTEAVAAGFGDTYEGQNQLVGQLRKTEVNIVLNEGNCKLLSEVGLGDNPQLICADGFSDNMPSGTCDGDFGGPLIVPGDTTDDQYSVGVLTGMADGCDPTKESAYSSFYDADHMAFVKEAVNQAGGSIQEGTPSFSPTPDVDPQPSPSDTQEPTPSSPDNSPTPSPDDSTTPSPDDSTTPSTQPTPPPFLGGGGGAEACFPAEATVIVDVGGERTSRAMRDLQIGDRVQTGKESFSEVFAFTHRTEMVESDFVRVVAGDATVEMSPTHYIPVYERGLVVAAHLLVGDMVQLGSGKAAMVQSANVVTRRGLYNPQTMNDAIVVDGVVASTFTQTVHPQVARWLLLVPKLAYRLGVSEPLGRWFYATAPRLVLRLVPQGSPVLMSL